MDHSDTAHLASVVGALGAVLILLSGRRSTLLGGFALLAAAEVGLNERALHSSPSPAVLAAGLLALLAAAGAALALARHPALVTPLVLAAAPFRLPLDFDRSHRFFLAVAESGKLGRLLPLYAVLGVAVLALCLRVARGAVVTALPRAVALPAAIFFALACLSLLWTDDLEAGRNLLAFFLLPFATIVGVVGRAPFPPWLPRALAVIAVALASLFALVGIWQAQTHRLLFFAPNLEVSNAYTSYFRVTSLFRDPSLYARQLVLGAAVLLVVLWRRRLSPWLAAALLALLWAGLYFSYSQSSMVALVAVALGVTAVAGDRDARRLVAVVAAAIVLVGAGLFAATVRDHSARRVTSDRSRRVELAARVFVRHPVAGVGIGAQPRASQRLSDRYGSTPRFVSHTTPLTVAAELGVLGLLAYTALLVGAARLLAEVWRRDDALGLALGAVLLALLVHSLFYSGFFEDPITWLALAVAASSTLAAPRTRLERPVPAQPAEVARTP